MVRSVILLVFFAQLAYGQAPAVHLWRDSVTLATGSTFTNQFAIRNNSGSPLSLRLKIDLPASVQLLSPLPRQLDLLPGEISAVPIKGLLTQVPNSSTERVGITLTDTTGRAVQSLSFVLQVLEEAQAAILLSTPEQTLVLYATTAPARLPLRLHHQRLRTCTYQISAQSIPTGADERPFPLRVRLAARQDTLLYLTLRPHRNWSPNHPYQLAITIRDTTGAIVGTLIYKLMVATMTKQLISPLRDQRGGHGASLALSRLSNHQLSGEGRVWGVDSLGQGQVSYNVQYVDYLGTSTRQVQQAQLFYQHHHTLFQLGSLYDYHELQLIGWGAKVQLNQPGRRWSFWALQTSPGWVAPSASTWSGLITSVRYDRSLKRLLNGSWSASSSYFTVPGTARVGYLNFASLRFDRPGGHSFELMAGQSHESADRGASGGTSGYAGQFSYSYEQPTLRASWYAYLSNATYSGFQRGATLLNGQIAWRPKERTSLLTRLNLVRYQPIQLQTAGESYRAAFGNAVAELNLSYQVRSVQVNLRPYWHQQTDAANLFSQRADAWRVAAGFVHQTKRYHQFMLIYDLGHMINRSAMTTANGYLSQRLTTSLTTGAFGLWAYWQRGPYYLADFRSLSPGRMVTLSVTPTVTFALFSQRVQGTAGLTYLSDGLFDRVQYIATGRIRYNVARGLSVKLEGNGTPYSEQGDYAYSLYRFEVTRQFGVKGPRRNGQLQLSFFDDSNGNGQHDTEERWIDSLLVTVNDQTLLTNHRGTITYSNLPPGTYTVSAISVERKQQLADPIVYHEQHIVARSVSRLIPLRRTFAVSGRISCQLNTYDRMPCHLDRFVVYVYQNDKKLAFIPVLPDGSFTGHWPPGDYKLEVHDTERPAQPIVKTMPVTLSPSGQYPAINWQIDGATRTVDIQRFKSD